MKIRPTWKSRKTQPITTCRRGTRTLQSRFSMGNYCDEYIQRLKAAWQQSTEAIASYFHDAPEGTIVGLSQGDSENRLTPESFAGLLQTNADNPTHFQGLTSVDVIREFPLD